MTQNRFCQLEMIFRQNYDCFMISIDLNWAKVNQGEELYDKIMKEWMDGAKQWAVYYATYLDDVLKGASHEVSAF